MPPRFLGVPLVIWGALCLVLAVVWTIFWPKEQTASLDAPRAFVLRWFHALVWALLALAAFIAAFNVVGGSATARIVAYLALLTYGIFMLTLSTSR